MSHTEVLLTAATELMDWLRFIRARIADVNDDSSFDMVAPVMFDRMDDLCHVLACGLENTPGSTEELKAIVDRGGRHG